MCGSCGYDEMDINFEGILRLYEIVNDDFVEREDVSRDEEVMFYEESNWLGFNVL